MCISNRARCFVALAGVWAGICAIATVLSASPARAETFEQGFAVQAHGRGLFTSDAFRSRADVQSHSGARVAQFFPFFTSAPSPAPSQQRTRSEQRRYEQRSARTHDRRSARKRYEALRRERKNARAHERRAKRKWRAVVEREQSNDGDRSERPRAVVHRVETGERRRKVGRRVPPLSHKERIAALLRDPPPTPPTKGPLLLTVSIAKQTITLFDGGIPVAQGRVSTGTESRPTPMGVFSVLEKAWWHRSNMYSAAPMPFMQRITWSGVAIHSGELPGYRASHGCVRLTEPFALRLWYATRIGARVVISWDEIAPLEITHPLLFQPKPGTLPPPQKAPPIAPAHPYEGLISKNVPPVLSDQFDVADLADAGHDLRTDPGAAPDDDPVLDHMMNASADDGAGLDDEPGSGNEPRAVLAAASNSPVRLREPQDEADLGLAAASLPDQPLALASLWDRDRAGARPPLEAFQVARRSAKRARHNVAREPAPAPQYTLERVLRPGPISVLISRKERRIYVRKGMQPLFDAPVSIANPERAMGTHVFTAEGVTHDATKLRWTVVSPSTHPTSRTAISTVAARAALDRITLPETAVARITDLMSTGATLIVTDAGLGRTAQTLDSDFTVLLR